MRKLVHTLHRTVQLPESVAIVQLAMHTQILTGPADHHTVQLELLQAVPLFQPRALQLYGIAMGCMGGLTAGNVSLHGAHTLAVGHRRVEPLQISQVATSDRGAT